MQYRVQGHYTTPYTWEVKRLDVIVNISSAEKAIKWVQQTYYRARVFKVTVHEQIQE